MVPVCKVIRFRIIYEQFPRFLASQTARSGPALTNQNGDDETPRLADLASVRCSTMCFGYRAVASARKFCKPFSLPYCTASRPIGRMHHPDSRPPKSLERLSHRGDRIEDCTPSDTATLSLSCVEFRDFFREF
jgi:hypothetical protein